MKKKDLFYIAINLVVTIALTLIYVLSNFKDNINNILENIIIVSLVTLYLLCSKVVYERIKSNDKHMSVLNRITNLYVLVTTLYVVSFLIKNIYLSFIFSAVFLSIFFMYFVTFTSTMYKVIDKKEKTNLYKVLIILLSIIFISLLVLLILKNILKGTTTYEVTLSLLQIASASSLMSMVIVGCIYVLKKLILIK